MELICICGVITMHTGVFHLAAEHCENRKERTRVFPEATAKDLRICYDCQVVWINVDVGQLSIQVVDVNNG